VLEADYSVSCETSEYKRYRAAALVLVALVPVGVPAALLAALLHAGRRYRTQYDAAGNAVRPRGAARAGLSEPLASPGRREVLISSLSCVSALTLSSRLSALGSRLAALSALSPSQSAPTPPHPPRRRRTRCCA
jgi:hypothetical protein